MVGLHAKVGQREIAAFLGEQSQHDGLAERARHGGDADVHVVTGNALADPAVLGQTAFGDVDAGDELDARCHRRESLDGLGQPGVQDAVDAHAHRELLHSRFNVDVGRFEVHGLRQQVADQGDDRCFLGQLTQLPRGVTREQRFHGALLGARPRATGRSGGWPPDRR